MNTDFYGRIYNDAAFCGPRIVKFYFSNTLTEVPWLYLVQTGLNYSIQIDPQDMVQDLGTHNIDIVTSLLNYDKASIDTRPWTVIVDCPSDPQLLVKPVTVQ